MTFLSVHSRKTGLIFASILGGVLLGCAKDANSANSGSSVPVSGPPGQSVTASSTVAASSTPVSATNAQSSASSTSASDTLHAQKIEVPSVPGRTKKDSIALVSAIRAGLKDTRWPVKTAAPLPGSILPEKRIVAFYGNPLSKKMGILGELPPPQMLARFDQILAQWRAADPTHPVQPALQLIAVVAQGAPGRDGNYRLRMTDSLINMVAGWAAQRNALLILDVQVGKSTLQQELPRLVPFLQRPNVELAIDPEFSMKTGNAPGTKIGTMDASDVNYASGLLRGLVEQYHLPPKILIVHRFTRKMVTGAKAITLDPRVQIVMDMDGWGPPWLKFDSYRDYEEAEPVQFTGFKLFFHNDTKKGDPILTPAEVLRLTPKPLYIQYQ
jgi:hypothetical protein